MDQIFLKNCQSDSLPEEFEPSGSGPQNLASYFSSTHSSEWKKTISLAELCVIDNFEATIFHGRTDLNRFFSLANRTVRRPKI
jgi:hypothetical protein